VRRLRRLAPHARVGGRDADAGWLVIGLRFPVIGSPQRS
jgi:hypothetical protein